MKKETEKKILNTKKAAEFLGGISLKTLARWRTNGKGPVFIDMEGYYFYRVEDLEEYLNRRTRHPSEGCAA